MAALTREVTHSGKLPAPVTPYQKAQQAWDDRIGSARVQARNWRLVAFGCLSLALIMAGGFVYQASQSKVTPYVVEVSALGEVKAVGQAEKPYQPTDAQIAHQLARFIVNVRSLPTDAVVVRRQWFEAYDYVTEAGAAVLNAYARANDPFTKVGKVSVTVEVTSIVRASPNSFQIRWTERAFADGAPAPTTRWTAIVSVAIEPPRDEDRLRKNPLGIYVNSINWSRELGSASNP